MRLKNLNDKIKEDRKECPYVYQMYLYMLISKGKVAEEYSKPDANRAVLN